MAMTHLTGVADRIDRSNSPWGGREERELYKLFKDLRRLSVACCNRIVVVNVSERRFVAAQPPRVVQSYDPIFCAK
jgi:hypothetical protein